MKMPDILKLIISLVLCQLAGVLGSVLTGPSISTWYATLKKPSFAPPNWLFGPVWITLFVLMGIALYLVWRQGVASPEVRIGLLIFVIQLLLNIAWSAAFFALRSPLGGLVVIGLLWVAILLTIISFSRVSTAAGLLLAPYILWVSFAALLNASLWALNRP